MLVDEKKLRWCGIDMRSRRRRRIAVIATYSLLFCLFIWWTTFFPEHPYLSLLGWGVLHELLVWFSVLGLGRLVKRFEEKHVLKIHGRSMEIVEGLDGWSQHLFGVESFAAASTEQQNELLNRFRLGQWLVPSNTGDAFATPWLDERERAERGKADRWTLKMLAGILTSFAGTFVVHAMHPRKDDAMSAAFFFFVFAQLTFTLPRARILWTEPDPRDVFGELSLLAEQQGGTNAG